jgi:hypothetical protein
MNTEQFEKVKTVHRFDEFFETALRYDGLTLQDYQAFMPVIFEVVPQREEKDPLLMYEGIIAALRERWTASEQLPFHGPWHHGLVAGILLAALRNNGYAFDDADIAEALKRGLMIPGGGCGMHGTCGAGAGLGVALSVVSGATPFHDAERSQVLEAVSEVIRRIAKLGGPRCCALSTYTALNLAVKTLAKLGYPLPSSPVAGRCKNHALNAQCHGSRCPYYPKTDR